MIPIIGLDDYIIDKDLESIYMMNIYTKKCIVLLERLVPDGFCPEYGNVFYHQYNKLSQ
jgi:hypothetical protein